MDTQTQTTKPRVGDHLLPVYLWVCSYDWNDYGHGVDAVCESEADAVNWTLNDPSWINNKPGLEVYDPVQQVFTDDAGNYRYITRVKRSMNYGS